MSRWTRKYGRAPVTLPEPEGAEVAAPVLSPDSGAAGPYRAGPAGGEPRGGHGQTVRGAHLSAARGGGCHQPGVRAGGVHGGGGGGRGSTWSASHNPCAIKGLAWRRQITHSVSPTKAILHYAKEIQPGPGDHGRARARRAEGPDFRHDDQSGEASSGRADADCAAGEELTGRHCATWDRLSQSCVTGGQVNIRERFKSCDINEINWHARCS